MNPNWTGVAAALLAFIAFYAVFRLAEGASPAKRIPIMVLAIVAAIPGASFAVYYAHLFPEPSWYYQFRSIAGTEFLIVFIGIAGGLVAASLPRHLLFFPLIGVLAFSTVPFIKPFIGPISTKAFEDKWEDEVCLQSTPSTCGAASTATILKQLGVETTEAELAAEAHSYAGGTEAWYLARAARSRGVEVDFDFTPGFPPSDVLPAVVGVRLGRLGHFIPILGEEEGQFIVGDPLRGRERLSRAELLERYVFTGFHMRIRNQNSHEADPPPSATST